MVLSFCLFACTVTLPYIFTLATQFSVYSISNPNPHFPLWRKFLSKVLSFLKLLMRTKNLFWQCWVFFWDDYKVSHWSRVYPSVVINNLAWSLAREQVITWTWVIVGRVHIVREDRLVCAVNSMNVHTLYKKNPPHAKWSWTCYCQVSKESRQALINMIIMPVFVQIGTN